ncbi:MAG TPA: histidine kinase [Catenuloplanes sp.]
MSGMAVPEYRWLLPGALTVDLDDQDDQDERARPVRRSTRDWLIDTVCFTLSVTLAVLSAIDLFRPRPTVFVGNAGGPEWLLWTDLVASLLVAAALWCRRRWPVGLAVAALPLTLFSLCAITPLLIIVFSVAVHRRFLIAGAVATGYVLGSCVGAVIRPDKAASFLETVVWTVVVYLLVLIWGMFVRARRQLVVSLRDRARRAESEQLLRVGQARVLERARIAREMHDVLAHRISLVSLHAGALEIRPDSPAAEVARAAGVIRASAHQALQDLREVIGVLRDDSAGDGPERPQPTLDALAALVQESQAAGMQVRLDLRIDPAAVPAGTGRTAYRIVQEGLTNARKHAPAATTTVRVAGSPASGLTIAVSNAMPVERPPTAGIPGTGTGLVGLAERATLAGGRLAYGRTGTGEFLLTAWLPWPT